MTCTQGRLDYDWIYSLKTLAHFRSKVLEDFPHYVTQINCLTGAIIARHILRRLYLTKRLYDPPQYDNNYIFFSFSYNIFAHLHWKCITARSLKPSEENIFSANFWSCRRERTMGKRIILRKFLEISRTSFLCKDDLMRLTLPRKNQCVPWVLLLRNADELT